MFRNAFCAAPSGSGSRAALLTGSYCHGNAMIRTGRYKYVRRFDDYPYPVLANWDDSPSKDAYLACGWGQRPVARESLHDLFFDAREGHNVIDDPDYASVAADLRGRLTRWMQERSDPLLNGAVPAPPGAWLNAQEQMSAQEPTHSQHSGDAPTEITLS